jgi:hypothetical protein
LVDWANADPATDEIAMLQSSKFLRRIVFPSVRRGCVVGRPGHDTLCAWFFCTGLQTSGVPESCPSQLHYQLMRGLHRPAGDL